MGSCERARRPWLCKTRRGGLQQTAPGSRLAGLQATGSQVTRRIFAQAPPSSTHSLLDAHSRTGAKDGGVFDNRWRLRGGSVRWGRKWRRQPGPGRGTEGRRVLRRAGRDGVERASVLEDGWNSDGWRRWHVRAGAIHLKIQTERGGARAVKQTGRRRRRRGGEVVVTGRRGKQGGEESAKVQTARDRHGLRKRGEGWRLAERCMTGKVGSGCCS